MNASPWFGLYLPQIRMDFETILTRTVAAERSGWSSVWLMDHLAAPVASELDTFEGWTLAAALAARTERIRVGHLTTCDPFRHPAVLAKMAATTDVISGGRLELGIGWGSVPHEMDAFGFEPASPRERATRLGETLEIVRLMFSGETFDYDGTHFRMRGAIGRPVPAQDRIPVHIGGGGVTLTMPLVAEHADWWNCPGYAYDRFDELAPRRGRARISVQHPVGLARDPGSRDEVQATVERRFGAWGATISGTAADVVDALCSDVARGVEGFVVQLHDFGHPDTIELFAAEVIPAVEAAAGAVTTT